MTYPFPNFNGCTIEVRNWWVISLYTLLGMWLLIHVGIQVNLCSWKGKRASDSLGMLKSIGCLLWIQHQNNAFRLSFVYYVASKISHIEACDSSNTHLHDKMYSFNSWQFDSIMPKRHSSIVNALELCFFWINSLWPIDTIWCRDLCQHWFRQWLVAWWHQAISWTNVDLSSLRSSDVHLRAISSLEIS